MQKFSTSSSRFAESPGWPAARWIRDVAVDREPTCARLKPSCSLLPLSITTTTMKVIVRLLLRLHHIPDALLVPKQSSGRCPPARRHYRRGQRLLWRSRRGHTPLLHPPAPLGLLPFASAEPQALRSPYGRCPRLCYLIGPGQSRFRAIAMVRFGS